MRNHTRTKILIYPIRNDFFGERITVAGLITGQDLIRQLTGQELGTRLSLPCSMFRSEEEVFLDDITRSELEEALQVPVDIVKSSGTRPDRCDYWHRNRKVLILEDRHLRKQI